MRIQAFSWCLLLSLFQILSIVRVSSECLGDQRLLLLQLKKSLVFDMALSTKLASWSQQDEEDCCNWNGVACDTSGRVIGLDLVNEGISGGIDNSSSLFNLQYLQSLNMAFNVFIGDQIPRELANLTNLSYLNLSNAGFGGQVPTEVSTLKRLVVLDLSTLWGWDAGNLKLENPNLQKLVGNLKELRELYLDYVDVSSQKSEWCQVLSSSLPNLSTLSLPFCGLSGPLDSSLSKLRSLSVLRLQGNNLSTSVPESIFQLSTLHILDLSLNELLSGTIPQLPMSSSLSTIVLSFTNFSGSLPDSISNLRKLSYIDLSNCNFSGMIPPSISNLTQLVYLDFSYNSFIGAIPPFYMTKKLVFLDLSRNFLTGSLTSKHFEGLYSLESLYLMNNSLNGSIPVSLFALTSLQKLLLSNNKFSGQIGEFPISITSLDTLELSSNHLVGPIPDSFFKLEHISVLSLSSNLFNGTVKLEAFKRLHNLTRLELGYNDLSVDVSNNSSISHHFPQLSRLNLAYCNLYNFPDLRNQSFLAYLDLSNNRIGGEVPSWIWNVGEGIIHLNLSHNHLVDLQKPFNMSIRLGVLDLHSNRLQGQLPMLSESAVYVDYSSNNFHEPIPDNFFNPFLVFFSLANNSLTGPIPASVCNATYLEVLDLSTNTLNGSIPPCLGNITSLGVLNLRRNNLSGNIPDTFPPGCSLRTLDLSNNNLEGNISRSLANCRSLEVMNVGNNFIEDTFPCWLKNSSSLRLFSLRNNKFHGDLSCSGVNESLLNLQIMDISSNNFEGEIPPRFMASWRGMVLDSDAQLRGHQLRFDFLDMNNFYFQNAVTVANKGLQMELVKILTIFTSIDFSCNNFSGEIPKTIGSLTLLYVLNLSHNSFTGVIPGSVGNLRQLGSLDLSRNHLTGEIPRDLANLTFLEFLNLSYNKLVGRIPSGSQLQTFSADSFVGNSGLCGFPLDRSCNAPDGNSTDSTSSSKNRDFVWNFVFAGWGYVVGLSLFFASLVFNNKWRIQFSKQLDKILDLIIPKH